MMVLHALGSLYAEKSEDLLGILLFDRAGEIVGLAGLMRDCSQAGSLLGPYRNLAKAIEFIRRITGRVSQRICATVGLSQAK